MWYIGYLNEVLGLYREKPDGADWMYDGKPLLRIYNALKRESDHTTTVSTHYPFTNYLEITKTQGFRYRAVATVETDEELLHIIENFATLYPELLV